MCINMFISPQSNAEVKQVSFKKKLFSCSKFILQSLDKNAHFVSERENIDPLDQVVAANNETCNVGENTQGQGQRAGSQVQSSGHVLQERQLNHGSIFSNETRHVPDATSTLLSNMERLSPYREMPNVFADAASHQMVLDSVRSEEVGRYNEVQRSRSLGGIVADIPPEQRLFANPGTGTSSSSHIIFDASQNMSRGSNSGQPSLKERRQQQLVSSAPASNAGINKQSGINILSLFGQVINTEIFSRVSVKCLSPVTSLTASMRKLAVL